MPVKGHPTQTICRRLLIGEANKILVAAPGSGRHLVITKVNFQVVTSAAQAVDVGHNGGGPDNQVLSLPASATGTGGVDLGDGFLMGDDVALMAVPAAAGPAIQFQVEYYIKAK